MAAILIEVGVLIYHIRRRTRAIHLSVSSMPFDLLERDKCYPPGVYDMSAFAADDVANLYGIAHL